MAALTVAVIGARRVRNGTGPFLALHAAAAGAEVVSVLGTSEDSAYEAAAWLQERGLNPRAFHDWESLVAATAPDVLIVASPTGTHRPWLAQARAAGCHVLCEKPLLTAPAEVSERIAMQYAAQGLVLEEICQWPYSLKAFEQLHPQVDLQRVTRFRMLLAPPLRGLLRWQEMLSHPLSLLQQLSPGPAELQNIHFHEHAPEDPDVRVDFQYQGFTRNIQAEFVLEDLGRFPRPAEYALDDHLCRRVVEGTSYDIGFTAKNDGEQSEVTCGDPMAQQVTDFLARVVRAKERQEAALDESLLRRQFLLEALLEQYHAHREA